MSIILNDIKKMIGLDASYTAFDTDLIIYINSAISTLRQLGVGPTNGYVITSSTVWNDYISDTTKIEYVKTYIYLKVRLIFDPPQSSAVLDSINNQIKELEWRLNVDEDPWEAQS